MPDYTHLIGAEDVSRAGHNMQHAAESFSRSMMTLDNAVDRLERILSEHADRMEQIMRTKEAGP